MAQALRIGPAAGARWFRPGADSTSADRPVPDHTALLDRPLDGLKIGLPVNISAGLDGAVAQVVEEAIAEYRKLGAETVEISLPNSRGDSRLLRDRPAECSSNLARFRRGTPRPPLRESQDLLDLYTRSRGEGFGAGLLSHPGRHFRAIGGYYDAYF